MADQITNQQKDINFTPLAIIIAGALIAGVIFYTTGSSHDAKPENTGTTETQPSTPSRTNSGSVDIINVDVKNEPFIGNANAPVTIAYWFDFQCPFCKRFELQTLPTLVNEYVKAGKLKVVFKDFQFLGPDSQTAGLVEKAVWELYPNSYFKWHEAMFNAQDGENSGFGNLESILALIRNEVPKIDADKIAAQVDNRRSEYQQEQNTDKIEGSQFGINGTPGFVLGKQIISGAQPISVFTQLIDTELNR